MSTRTLTQPYGKIQVPYSCAFADDIDTPFTCLIEPTEPLQTLSLFPSLFVITIPTGPEIRKVARQFAVPFTNIVWRTNGDVVIVNGANEEIVTNYLPPASTKIYLFAMFDY